MSVDRFRFAVLIDGDNTQPALIPQILARVEKYGEPVIRRVYGDWSNEALKGWKPVVHRHALETSHSFNGSAGKNATDIALVVDAMELVLGGQQDLQGFALVSSDSDFTRLATRIRQLGKKVIGIGRANTTQSFQESCDVFITTESLQNHVSDKQVVSSLVTTDGISDAEFREMFIRAYRLAVKRGFHDEQGWIKLSHIKTAMAAQVPGFQSSENQNTHILAQKIKALAKIAPGKVRVRETEGKPVVHLICVRNHSEVQRHSEIGRFRSAYNAAVNELNDASNDGWVSLSPIGTMLRKLFPDCDPNQYRETSHKQLKKVVELLVQDYPDAIELKSTRAVAWMRMKA